MKREKKQTNKDEKSDNKKIPPESKFNRAPIKKVKGSIYLEFFCVPWLSHT